MDDVKFDEQQQFQLYEKLMLLAMEKPNEINEIEWFGGRD